MDTPILIELHSTLSLRAKLWLLCKIYFRKFLASSGHFVNIFTAIGEWINEPRIVTTIVTDPREIERAFWIESTSSVSREDPDYEAWKNKIRDFLSDSDIHKYVYEEELQSWYKTGDSPIGIAGVLNTRGPDWTNGKEHYVKDYVSRADAETEDLFRKSYYLNSCNYYVGSVPTTSYYISRPYIDLRWDTYANGQVDYNAK